MKLSLSVIFVVLIAASFVAMMHIKNGVRDMRSQSQALMEKRGGLLEAARVLEAERAYLARSERLEMFARKQGLKEIHHRQLVRLPEISRVNRAGARPSEGR